MQIDFHFGATYAIARLAGFTDQEAHTIAYSAQYVDDSTTSGFIRFDNGVRFYRQATAHPPLDIANINNDTGVAVFEATHGTAPKYANQDKVNPGSLILSGEMMFRYLGWTEVADLLLGGMERTIAAKTVTYDFARQMEGATLLSCSAFARAVAGNL